MFLLLCLSCYALACLCKTHPTEHCVGTEDKKKTHKGRKRQYSGSCAGPGPCTSARTFNNGRAEVAVQDAGNHIQGKSNTCLSKKAHQSNQSRKTVSYASPKTGTLPPRFLFPFFFFFKKKPPEVCIQAQTAWQALKKTTSRARNQDSPSHRQDFTPQSAARQ